MEQIVKFAPMLFNLGTGIAGMVGNIQANKAKNAELAKQQAIRDKLANMSTEDIIKGVQALSRPMSGGLVKGVGNIVQASMAEKGLTGSGPIWADVFAQALAPYQQHETDRATQAFFDMLRLPLGAAPNPAMFPETQDYSKIWQDLFTRAAGAWPGSKTSSTSSSSSSGLSDFTWLGAGSPPG